MAIAYRAPLCLSGASRALNLKLLSSSSSLPGQFLLRTRLLSPPPPPFRVTEALGFVAHFPCWPPIGPAYARMTASSPYDRSPAVVTQSTWEECVLKSKIPVLVMFRTSWCGPCNMVDRVIEELFAEYANKIKFLKLDADDDFQTATDYEVDRVPTVLFFKNGMKIKKIVGTMPREIYEAAIHKGLASDDDKLD